jgi:hypothetical protein
MAWTQTDLDNLEAAIAAAAVAGFATLRVGDKELQRYTLKELMDLRAVMRGAVTTTDRFSLAGFSKD